MAFVHPEMNHSSSSSTPLQNTRWEEKRGAVGDKGGRERGKRRETGDTWQQVEAKRGSEERVGEEGEGAERQGGEKERGTEGKEGEHNRWIKGQE